MYLCLRLLVLYTAVGIPIDACVLSPSCAVVMWSCCFVVPLSRLVTLPSFSLLLLIPVPILLGTLLSSDLSSLLSSPPPRSLDRRKHTQPGIHACMRFMKTRGDSHGYLLKREKITTWNRGSATRIRGRRHPAGFPSQKSPPLSDEDLSITASVCCLYIHLGGLCCSRACLWTVVGKEQR